MPVSGVVEDLDEVAGCVVDTRVDLRLHVGDRRGVGQLALVRVVSGEHRADGAGADRGEDRDEDEHDAEHAAATSWLAQVAVGASTPAAELGARGCLRGADPWVGRTGRPYGRSPRSVGKARPAAPAFG